MCVFVGLEKDFFQASIRRPLFDLMVSPGYRKSRQTPRQEK